MSSTNLLTLMITIQIILLTINSSQGAKDPSIINLKLNPPQYKYKLEATVTDQVNNKTFKVIEYLNGLNPKASYGKIRIFASHTINVYHNQIDDNGRLVSMPQYNLCYYLDRKLITLLAYGGDLLNLILITGPSIVFRLQDQSLNWTSNDNSAIRTTITDDNKLNIKTIYNQTVNQSENDLIVPDKTIFSGSIAEPRFESIDNNETIIVDLISLVKLDSKAYHDTEFKPPIGFGCPSLSIEEVKLFPELSNSRQLSYKAIETVSRPAEDKKTSQIEIHVDSDKIVTIKQNIAHGIVDYNSSICSVSTINTDNYLDQVNHLIWFNGDHKYRGKFPSQSKGDLDTWESTKYEETINGTKYDRVVTINQFQKINSTINSTDYIPVNSTQIIYNEVYFGQFILIESRTRIILKFDNVNVTIAKQMEQLITNCNLK